MTDSNDNKFLPPSKTPTTKFGHLTITIQNLTFFSESKQSCVIKLQFWGSPNPLYIPLFASEAFTIVAPLNLFKTYLIDCKTTQFQIVDSRNYKPIASAFLNWMPYLRTLEDKQVYIDKQDQHLRDKSNVKTFYLPFYDEVIQQNLSVYHFTAQNQVKRQEKVGELTVKWQCRMYEPQVQSHTASNINSGANLYNIRVSQFSNKKNDHGPVSICNIDIQEDPPGQDIRTNRSILSKQRQSNSPKLYTTEYPMQRRSNISIFDNYAGNLKKVREEPQMDQSRTHIGRGKNINELDLELIRMRMEMEELVGPTNKKIVHFQAIPKGLSSKDITFCDIRSQGKDKGSHWRIFPESTNQEKTYFYSTLSIKPGSLLSFVLGTKKGKETYKGSMPIDCIRESYDVNIISSLGPVVGYLRVKIQRKSEINKDPIISNATQQNYQKVQSIKKELLPLSPPIPKIAKEPKGSNKNNESHYQSQKIKEPQAYFLFNVQSIRNKYNNFGYKIFDMMIAQVNPQKIAFVSQGQFSNKPLIFTVYQHNKQIYQQNLIKQMKITPFASVNLTCSLIFEKIIPELQLNCQLYAGNLKQINYYLQKVSQVQERNQSQHIYPQNQMNFPVRTQQSNKNSLIAQYEMQNLQQDRRKLKTEAKGMQERDRRLTEEKVSGQSVAMEKFEMHSENQANNEEENIYLVDLLTRFLDFLPENLLPQISQMPKETFLAILTPKLKVSSFQYELVEIIISIFQDVNGQSINIVQLLQCYKAYQSFFNIYQQQKQTIIKQILQVQPKAVQRIRNNSEFGTLNDSMLWGRALSKVKDISIKQKLNKFYKISSFGSTDAALLLDDLESKGKQLRSLDISNLGMMIKDWVQEFVSHAQLQKILNLKEKILNSGEQDNYLNIRSVSDVIEMTLQLRLSLWESLMLIEEIKGSYGCDLQLEQGVIGGTSLLNWIDSVRKRTKLRTDNSRLSDSEVSLDPDELALIKQINQHNRNDSEVIRRESGRRSESRSMVGVNNDSDIADIANLLREKDGLMQLELIEQTKTKHIRENKSLLPQERIIKDSLREDNEPIEQVIFNKREQPAVVSSQVLPSKAERQKQNQRVSLPKEKEKLKEMKFYLQIKEFKLYDETMKLQLIKALFLLENSYGQTSQDSFFYLTSKHNFSQANQSIIKYTIDKTVKLQHKGVKIALQDETNKLLYSGFLPMEEINEWFSNNQQQCKRTIVLYEPRGKIGGKLVITLMLSNEAYERRKQDEEKTKFSERIGITVNRITPLLKGVKLYARSDENDRQQLHMDEQIQLQLHRPIYHCQLIIGNEVQSFASIISLEELYLKNYICESYPLIDANSGTFIATISITLTYNLKANRKKELALAAKRESEDMKFVFNPPQEEESLYKKGVISQIDGIYQSLKLKYG